MKLTSTVGFGAWVIDCWLQGGFSSNKTFCWSRYWSLGWPHRVNAPGGGIVAGIRVPGGRLWGHSLYSDVFMVRYQICHRLSVIIRSWSPREVLKYLQGYFISYWLLVEWRVTAFIIWLMSVFQWVYKLFLYVGETYDFIWKASGLNTNWYLYGFDVIIKRGF